MRDWIRSLPRASFRGVAFHVEKASLPKSGRSVVVHRFVKSEQHATEDMARLPREFRVQAYLVGDSVDAESAAFVEACSANGPGLLVLPFFAPASVRCTGCAPSWEKAKLGLVAFDLDFVEAGGDGAGFPAVPLGDRLAASALDTLAGAVQDAIAGIPR